MPRLCFLGLESRYRRGLLPLFIHDESDLCAAIFQEYLHPFLDLTPLEVVFPRNIHDGLLAPDDLYDRIRLMPGSPSFTRRLVMPFLVHDAPLSSNYTSYCWDSRSGGHYSLSSAKGGEITVEKGD
jgi:hypothetical protein